MSALPSLNIPIKYLLPLPIGLFFFHTLVFKPLQKIWWARRGGKVSVGYLRGPESPSWVFGNMHQLLAGQAGEMDIKWQSEYGTIVRIKGPFGQDVLMVSDPKAIHHLYQASGYKFPKPPERRVLTSVVNGKGVANVEGDDHKRQRKVMLPAFGAPSIRPFVPIFNLYASKLTTIWRDTVQTNASADGSATIDIVFWGSRAMLDALGDASFDYHFGTMENMQNQLATAYMRVALILLGRITKPVIVFSGIAQILPFGWLRHFLETSNGERLSVARYTRDLATSVARDLVAEKQREMEQGEMHKDILSMLIKANNGEDPTRRMSEDELYAQLRTILIAGHETSSSTLSWALLELCKRPEAQTKLRAEIRSIEQRKAENGEDPEFTWSDFENMPYLQAVTKETLRFHPVAYNSYRWASEDDVIPLAYPLTTKDGKTVTQIPVGLGQRFITSPAAYNRIKDIWGEDADEWIPERWLVTEAFKSSVGAPNIGVYNNLFTFSGGNHTCTGWRFAVIELQCFLTELISNFEFSMTQQAYKVRREACGVMSPTIEGEVEKGFQLPLRVKPVVKDDLF